MGPPRLVLASASPTRLRVLRQAGLDPAVAPSGVDESVGGDVAGAAATAAALAERKAAAVTSAFPGALVLGCDSVVELDGRVVGKPASPAQAVAWWRSMRGRSVRVWTGHCVIDARTHRVASRTADAEVHFATPTDDEVDRYVASGEPLGAAGAFRLDGRAAAFIDHVVGDPGTVHGVSVAIVRQLLAELHVEITDLWA